MERDRSRKAFIKSPFNRELSVQARCHNRDASSMLARDVSSASDNIICVFLHHLHTYAKIARRRIRATRACHGVKRKRPQKHGTFLGLSHLASIGGVRGIPSTCELSYAITRVHHRLVTRLLIFTLQRCFSAREIFALDARIFQIPRKMRTDDSSLTRIKASEPSSFPSLCVHTRAPLLSFVNL